MKFEKIFYFSHLVSFYCCLKSEFVFAFDVRFFKVFTVMKIDFDFLVFVGSFLIWDTSWIVWCFSHLLYLNQYIHSIPKHVFLKLHRCLVFWMHLHLGREIDLWCWGYRQIYLQRYVVQFQVGFRPEIFSFQFFPFSLY